jgi:hypothetical protein
MPTYFDGDVGLARRGGPDDGEEVLAQTGIPMR